MVLINGRLAIYMQGLETKISDGDTIVIGLLYAGGMGITHF